MTGPRREDDPRASLEPSPELVRLVARHRSWSALAVIVVSIALVGLGWWKPWVAARVPSAAASGTLVAASPATPDTAQPPSPADSDTASTTRGSADQPAFLGLDLSRMGSRVRRDGWGVATAAVLRDAIERSSREPGSAITPVATWTTIRPGSRPPGPAIAGADHVTVALAVTWPSGIAPRRVRLEYLGPADGSSATFGPRERRTIPLSVALPGLVAPVPAGWRGLPGSAASAWERKSGTFFLSPTALAGDPVDWSAGGWTGGAYAFQIETDDGSIVRLPFRLGG